MKKTKKFTYTLAAIIAVIVFFISSFVGGGAEFVHAATSAKEAYEATNVWDNLQGSTIAGNAFNIEDYPFSENSKPQIISFIEFGYSYYANKQSDFGLYVYVYNPQQLALDTDSERNNLHFRCPNIFDYCSFKLRYLNYSNAVGYEGRFYKFEIVLPEEARTDILDGHKSNNRIYEISEITLSYKHTATGYTVAQKYTYSGFAEGYGSELATSNTLSCIVDNFDKYIELDVSHTEYRPKGDYYNGEQSQLNSVYFRVPEKFFTDYGELTEIACEWYEYFTKPLLVSNDKQTVDAINSLYGRKTMELPTDNYYLLFTYWQNITSSWFDGTHSDAEWTSNRDYSGDWYKFGFLWEGQVEFDDESGMDGYAAAFYSSNLDSESVDNAVSGDAVLQMLREHSEKLGGNKIRDRYSEALFEDYVQDGYNRGYNYKTIKNTDKMDIYWRTLKAKTAWQKMFGGKQDFDTLYDSLEAIKVIEDKDLIGSNEEVSENLRINKSDVAKFTSEYAKAKLKNERLVLFRYSTTKYMCAPGVSARCKGSEINSGTSDGEILVNDCYYRWRDKNWNCYTAQETVYLDFDIISLTYTKDNVETVIPVVMSPMDIAGDLTPPLKDPTSDGSGCNGVNWKLIFGVVVLVVVLILTYPLWSHLIGYVLDAVIWLITLPFRAIGKLFKRKKE